MDPLSWLFDHVLAGRYGSVGALIAIAVIISRGLTKLEGHASAVVATVGGIADDSRKAREERTEERRDTLESIARVERRVDTLEHAMIKTITLDGTLTREQLANRRISELADKVAAVGDTVEEATNTVRKRTASRG